MNNFNRLINVKLEPEFLKQWTTELLSGNTEQAVERLAEDDTRCCLGLACDVAADNEIINGNFLDNCFKFEIEHISYKVADLLPYHLIKKVVINLDEVLCYLNSADKMKPLRFIPFNDLPVDYSSSFDLVLPNEDGFDRKSLADLNDEGYTFENIAKLINKYFWS